MIWGWIGAAVALSWLLCRKKAAWHHLIWMLLPIETYGVSLAGATIKPYMMFGGLIILHNILRKKAHKILNRSRLCGQYKKAPSVGY